MPEKLPPFHPATVLRDWGSASPGASYRISDALTGCVAFGATGSGKSSGPARHLGMAYLAHNFGGLVLCSKPDDRETWERMAAETGRTQDLIIVDEKAANRFNFMDWEATRSGDEGGGLTINVVAILDEIAGAVTGGGKAQDGGDGKFWNDSLHHLLMNLVDLPLLANIPVSLPLMRAIVNSAPLTAAEVLTDKWQEASTCAAILREADAATKDKGEDVRLDFEECQSYWRNEFCGLSEKTRSIITLMFATVARPLVTRPLRRLFSTDTTFTPEDAFDGKIIICDLPISDFRIAGRIANIALKYCFQIAVLRRKPPTDGTFLRPCFLFADEFQSYLTDFDAEYQAVARSAGGCTVYLTQSRESLLRVLHSAASVDALLGNLQCKFFAQNSGDTNDWASKLLGERYVQITGTNAGRSNSPVPGGEATISGGVTRSEQRRAFVEPSRFTTLKRGGPRHNYQVETIVYNGGSEFVSSENGEMLPYALLTFNQR